MNDNKKQMKAKLYYATALVDVVFYSDETKNNELHQEATEAIKEELRNNSYSIDDIKSIKEVKSINDVPFIWRNSIPYYQEHDGDLTLCEIFGDNAEFQEYLRLKEKFKGK